MPATYKITLHNRYDLSGNELINVFGYHDQLALPAPMADLVSHFISDVLPDIAAITHENCFYYRVECEQVIGGAAYLDTTLSPAVQGTRVGETMPKFVAWGFEYRRVNRGERSGAKRIGLISETDVDNGEAKSTFVATLTATATALGDAIQVGIVDTWFPVILERPVPPSTSWGFHDLSGVQYRRVTTQNSRKPR